jgi:hypothetical protein
MRFRVNRDLLNCGKRDPRSGSFQIQPGFMSRSQGNLTAPPGSGCALNVGLLWLWAGLRDLQIILGFRRDVTGSFLQTLPAPCSLR